MHENDVLHRDIKPDNVLFSTEGHVKLCDFGITMFLSDEQTYRDSMQGTHLYMAPEMKIEVRYSKPVDIWSFGLLAYQLPTDVIPFRGQQELDNIMNQPTP